MSDLYTPEQIARMRDAADEQRAELRADDPRPPRRLISTDEADALRERAE